MFQEKTQEELAKMDATTLAAYFKEKSIADAAKITEMIAQKASKADIDAMKSEINETLKVQGLQIAQLGQGGSTVKEKTLREMLIEKAADLTAIKNGDAKRVQFTLDTKAAGTMTIAGNVTGEVPQSMREPGLNRIARRRPFVSDFVGVRPIGNPAVSWVEQVNPDGSPAFIAEGVLKPAIDFDMQVITETAKKVAANIKVSKEMLDDVDFMRSEIDAELRERINILADDQLLTGDGTGANLNGLITQATTFAAGIFAASIVDPNNYDVLRIAYNQVVLANFMPTTIFLHPSDMTMMQITKGTDGHYIEFPFVDESGTRMLGSVQIVANTGIPQDSFLIFDANKAAIFQREGLTISIGYSNDDFVKNLVTILAEQRLLLRIQGNDTLAFVTGEFSTAKAALQAP